MNHHSNNRLIFAATAVVLLMSVLSLPNHRLLAQTFEQPVTVLEDSRACQLAFGRIQTPNLLSP